MVVVAAAGLSAWVLWLKHAIAMRITDSEVTRLEAGMRAAASAWDSNQKALKAQLDDQERRIQHIDNRTKK